MAQPLIGGAQARPLRQAAPLPRINLRRQLRVVMWKNWVLTQRNPKDLIREWAIPAVLLVVMVAMRSSLQATTYPAETSHTVHSVPSLKNMGSNTMYFAPCASQSAADPVYAFMTKFQSVTGVAGKCFKCNRPTAGCSGEESMQATALLNMDDIWGGVEFREPSTLVAAAAGSKPPTVPYVIRMDSTLMPSVGSANITDNKFGPSGIGGEFYPTFLSIQQAVEGVIGMVTSGDTAPQLQFSTQQFPYPSYTIDIGTLVLSNIIPIYFLLIFSLQVRVLVMRILEEKQKRIKEGMKMMGLNDAIFFIAWMLTALIKGGVVVVIMTVVCKLGHLFSYSNWLIMLVWFLAFLLCCIAYTFIITAFFDQARAGGVVGMLLYLALFLPSLALRNASVPRVVQLLCCLSAPTAFSLGNGIFNDAETGEVGIQWDNLFASSSFGISMGECLIMILVDFCLYSVGAWYFDRVIPSEFGTHYEPLFCCRRRFWCPQPMHRDVASPLLEVDGRDVAIEAVSEEVEQDRAVTIAGLCKTFSTKEGPKKAVDHLHLTMYENQITCLLGHNGAGKTTTISMLTGLMPSTAGDATVYGRSIVSDIQGVRELTGVCPQYDILFDKLTVREHLILFGGIKGLPEEALQAQVVEMIAELGLQEKMNSLASTLSGGQKRRLSVAMALMGDPKVVFLDEPTSGLDPAARRAVWGVLERRKKGRVIVLCTHFMEEADILGDRIAVMARGAMQVVGSSLYLKNRFGLGYHLSMSIAEGADVNRVTDLITHHVPRASKEADLGADALTAAANRELAEATRKDNKSHMAAAAGAGASAGAGAGADDDDDADAVQHVQLSYVLPMDSVAKFAGLFRALEDQSADLAIQNYGLSMTTLEEVFLRLAEQVEMQEQQAAAAAADAARAAAAGKDLGAPRPAKRSMDLSKLGRRSARLSNDSAGHLAVDVDSAVGTKKKANSKQYAPLDHQAAVPLAFNANARLDKSASRHLKATVWRLARAARRDKRGLFMQMVLPCIFVGLSAVFRSIASTTPVATLSVTPMNPSQWTSLPSLTLPYAYSSITTQASNIVSHLPTSADLKGMPAVHQVSASAMTIDALDSYLIQHTMQAGALLVGGARQTLAYNTSQCNFLPIAMNLVAGAALRSFRNDHGFQDNAVPTTVAYDPFPLTTSEEKPGTGQFISAGLIGFYIALGFSAIPGLQALRIVQEREVKAKQQQIIMGMKPISYWIGNLAWDSLQFTVPWFLSCIILYAVGTPAYRIGQNFVALAAVLMVYGISNPCLVYAFSFLFDKHTSAQTFTMLFYYLGTMVTFFTVFVLSFPSISSIPSIVPEILNYVFLLFPNYALSKAFMNVNIKASCFEFGGPSALCTPPSPWSWDITGQNLVFLAASVPLWLGVVMLLERVLAPRPPTQTARPFDMDKGREHEDKDVQSERQRVDVGRADNDNVVVKHLRKTFPGRDGEKAKVAVADLTIGCREGECFGLLGPNGAGKTTALSMLTADLSPSFGAATVHGHDIFSQRDTVYSMMGYCPQFDALFELLTGEECLTFYARVKGIPEEEIPAFVDLNLTRMDLQRYRNEITKNYSGGNKRKLSLTVAFVGAPKTVFLDEPSTGMDPVARRHMWNIVSSSRVGRTIVLTTHLLEEADVLSSRIGILVQGRLACLGTPQRLKSVYGAGYRMEVNTTNPAMEPAVQEMVRRFCPEAQVLESHSGHINFELTREVSLAEVFATVEAERERLEILDYAVSQTSLEQVFLGFAKRQDEHAA